MTRTEYNKSVNRYKLVIEINKDLRDEFKKLCAVNDTTMKTVLKEFIESYNKKNKDILKK